MAQPDLSRIERNLRWTYELGRIRAAAVAMVPVAVLVAALVVLRGGGAGVVLLGGSLVSLALFYLWRGQALGRSFLPGLGAGLVPVVLANLWMVFGHPCCTPTTGISLCMVVCATGGTLGGTIMAIVAHRRRERASALVFAGIVAVLTGAMGCLHLGVASLGSISVGLLLGALTSLPSTAKEIT